MVPVSFASFAFCGHELALGAAPGVNRAIYWPAERALLVADLHLEKASHFARHGQFLPPYDSRETLERVGLALRQTGARRVFCLGDNFHDAQGPARLDAATRATLGDLVRGHDWVWITGNHDQPRDGATAAPVPGTHLAELTVGDMILRHEAQPDETAPELSGHFHPCLRVVQRGRAIRRPCAVATRTRLVLPAFGTLTGGLDAADPAIRAALEPAQQAEALVGVKAGNGSKLARFPLWGAPLRETARNRPDPRVSPFIWRSDMI